MDNWKENEKGSSGKNQDGEEMDERKKGVKMSKTEKKKC